MNFRLISLLIIQILTLVRSESISGFVREKSTGEPISYANVFLINKSLGSTTNQDGYFVIPNVPIGDYEINASMIGYSMYQKKNYYRI